jgi:glutamyl-tRNA synthetase
LKVRTRVAPSPTGDPHVGTAYIALFNYCFAKAHGGEFILRIEDTDQVRSTAESEHRILDALKWLGVQWDEGPDVGGAAGPYRQSERSAIYAEHASVLLERGHAFRCFCTRERLEGLRLAQRDAGAGDMGYDGHCMNLEPDEIQTRLSASEEHVIRMVVPRHGFCVVKDTLRDPIEIAWSTVDMQVLVKSDGMPTYHLANVVDDHLMGITHVLRGEEWISSAPKHLLLYQYFGWEPPALCHLPLLRNPDKSKLSKRKNPTSILYYKRLGFLPEALLNYLGMMAWTMPGGEEKFSLQEMVDNFDLARVSLGGPVFDVDKLTWLNGRYIREDLDTAQLAARIQQWALNSGTLMQIIPLIHQRIDKLSDAAPMAAFFLAGMLPITPEELVSAKLDAEATTKALQWALWRLELVNDWRAEAISDVLRSTADLLDHKLRDFLKPFFVAIAGRPVATPLFDSMEILGPDLARGRLRHAIGVLGGLSAKKLKKWEKEFESAMQAADMSEPTSD